MRQGMSTKTAPFSSLTGQVFRLRVLWAGSAGSACLNSWRATAGALAGVRLR